MVESSYVSPAEATGAQKAEAKPKLRATLANMDRVSFPEGAVSTRRDRRLSVDDGSEKHICAPRGANPHRLTVTESPHRYRGPPGGARPCPRGRTWKRPTPAAGGRNHARKQR